MTHLYRRPFFTAGLASTFVVALVAFGSSNSGPLSLSIEEYTARAVEKGITGRINAMTFESAGYTREIAFERNRYPTLDTDATVNRQGTDSGSGQTTVDSSQVNVSLNQVLPTGTEVQGQAGVTGTETTGLGTDSGTTSKNASASLSQPLYVFVKNPVQRSRRQADLSFANAQDTYTSTLLSLRTQGRNRYYQVLLGDESIKVAERKASAAKKLLDITKAMVEGGRTAPVETMRAKIRLDDDERRLQDALVSRAKAVLSAKDFIYLPLESDIQFTSRLEFKPLGASLDRLWQYARLHNPSLKTLNRRKELSQLDFETAREVTRPNLTLDSSFDFNETSSFSTRQWEIGGGVQWRFFDAFVTRDNVSKARIDIMIATLNLSEGERTTKLNINNAYLDIKNAERQIQDFSSSIDQARRNVDVLRLRFKNGLERLIDVFDAENDMRDLDNQYLNLLVRYNQLKDSLSETVGADVETLR